MSVFPGDASRPSGRGRRVPGRPKVPRKPEPRRFAALYIVRPDLRVEGRARGPALIASLALFGLFLGAFWPQGPGEAPPKEEIFTVAVETPPPPPEPPPPSEPPPPPPKKEPPLVPPPPKQFGIQAEEMAEKSDLTVAAGNTLMKKADSLTAAPPPPLPAEPILIDHPPRVISGRPPDYPERARDRGVEGVVIALITIDTLGRVLEAKVEKSGGADLDKSVLKSVQQTRFQAAVINGRRVPSRFRRPYEFRLEG